MSSKSGIIWAVAAALLAAGATGVEAGEAVAATRGASTTDGLQLPRLSRAVQLSRPTDTATLLLAQAGTGAAMAGDEAPAAAPQTSTRRAFLMSALVPGSGELWAGSKARAALFFGLEVAGLGTYISWDGKGNDLEDDFRARADTTYNPWNYLAWRDSRQSRFSSITHALPCSSYVASATSSTPIPDALHGCAPSQEQQFYELIGKYDQFVSGWKDVEDRDGNLVTYAEVDSAENFQSATRLSYEDDRNESNKYLKRASNVAGLILVNHVISAIDAARVARARNEGQSEAVIERRTRFGVAFGGSSGTTPLLLAVRPFP